MALQDLVVIGGGPAGMMAAIEAASAGLSVQLLERMPSLGRKLSITGKGRCNVTTAKEREEMLAQVRHNRRFLYSSLAALSSDDVMRFFTERGCPLKVERGERVFPVSDRAADVLKVLNDALKSAGVEVVTGARVRRLEQRDGFWQIHTEARHTGTAAKAVVLATGGASYPGTGSSGDGYELAKALDIPVVAPRAALVPLVTEQGWAQAAQGLSLRNVRLRIFDAKTLLYDGFGEMMCTHFGISGPLVLSASGALVDYWQDEKRTLSALVDLKPALDEKQLDERLLREIAAQGKKQCGNALKTLLPQKLITPFLETAGLDPRQRMAALNRAQRLHLVACLKGLPLTIIGARPLAEAIVTAGGIDVRSIDPKSMAVRHWPGLFVCGELIDVDALTGGHNLQIAFSTGAQAGRGVVRYIREEER